MTPTLAVCPPPPTRMRGPAIHQPAPRRLDLDATELAVAHFEQARRLEAEAWRAAAADPSLEKWAAVVALARQEAEGVLIATILAWGPEVRDMDLPRIAQRYHPGRGVRVGGRAYFALPRADVGPDDPPNGVPTMVLQVVDADAIHGPEVNGAGGV